MKDWHIEHIQKTIMRHITGLSDSMSPWEAKQYMKLYNIASVQKTISYDAKHGVSREEILSFIEILSTHPTYRFLQKNKLAMEKLEAIKRFVRLQINQRN